MGSAIQFNSTYVSLDCVQKNKPCLHDCEGKIQKALSYESQDSQAPLANRIDKEVKKPLYFENLDEVVHALCWVQAAKQRPACSECSPSLERLKEKLTLPETSSKKKTFSCGLKRIAKIAAFALAFCAALECLSLIIPSEQQISSNMGYGTHAKCHGIWLVKVCDTRHNPILGSVSNERTVQFPLLSNQKHILSAEENLPEIGLTYKKVAKCWRIPYLITKCDEEISTPGFRSKNSYIHIPYFNLTLPI